MSDDATGRVDFASLIIREGDRVSASGRVVRNETGDWFEPPVPVAEPGDLPRSVRHFPVHPWA